MNHCESCVRAIKKMCISEIPNIDIIRQAWDLQSVFADMQATVAANANITNVEGIPEQIYASSNVDYGWRGLILADNDCIYSVPNKGNIIHKIDAKTNIVTTIDVGEVGNCFRGCFATDRKIYMPPYESSYKLRVLDTTTDNLSYITLSSNEFGGSFCSNEGVIFNYPFGGSNWYVYNPSTGESISTFSGNFGGNSSRAGVNITLDGLVATSYNKAYNFIVWETIPTWGDITNSSYTPPTHTVSNSKYSRLTNGVFGTNGKVYCLPDASSNIVIFNLENNTIAASTKITSYTGTVGYDNSIYIACNTSDFTGIAKYSTLNSTLTTIGSSVGSSAGRVSGVVLWKDKLFFQCECGGIYVVPLNVNYVFNPATLLSPLINRP